MMKKVEKNLKNFATRLFKKGFLWTTRGGSRGRHAKPEKWGMIVRKTPRERERGRVAHNE